MGFQDTHPQELLMHLTVLCKFKATSSIFYGSLSHKHCTCSGCDLLLLFLIIV